MTTSTQVPPTGGGEAPRVTAYSFTEKVKQPDGSYKDVPKRYEYVEGTVAISVDAAGIILGIKASSVRALVCKDKISEVPREDWPNGKCQMVYAVIPREKAGQGLVSVFEYKETRGPSRFHE